MKNTKNKLSLDQFKAKMGDSTDSLELISGAILGNCHDCADAAAAAKAAGMPIGHTDCGGGDK